MEWSQLSVKDRAGFIRQMVSRGITNPKEQAQFYNNALNFKKEHKFDGEPSLGHVLSDKYGDYDMTAYNKSGMSQGENGHYPDDFKKPWHITYPSGKWVEPSLLEQQWTGNNQPIFVPSTHNYMYYTPEDYFNYPHDKTLTQEFIPTGWNRHLTF